MIVQVPVISSKASVIFSNLVKSHSPVFKKCCFFLFLENRSSKRHLYLFQQPDKLRTLKYPDSAFSTLIYSQSKPRLRLSVQLSCSPLVPKELFRNPFYICSWRRELRWLVNELALYRSGSKELLREIPRRASPGTRLGTTAHAISSLQIGPWGLVQPPAATNPSRDPRQLGVKRCLWASLCTAERSNTCFGNLHPWYSVHFFIYTTSTLVNTYSDILIVLLCCCLLVNSNSLVYLFTEAPTAWFTHLSCTLYVGHRMIQVGFALLPLQAHLKQKNQRKKPNPAQKCATT